MSNIPDGTSGIESLTARALCAMTSMSSKENFIIDTRRIVKKLMKYITYCFMTMAERCRYKISSLEGGVFQLPNLTKEDVCISIDEYFAMTGNQTERFHKSFLEELFRTHPDTKQKFVQYLYDFFTGAKITDSPRKYAPFSEEYITKGVYGIQRKFCRLLSTNASYKSILTKSYPNIYYSKKPARRKTKGSPQKMEKTLAPNGGKEAKTSAPRSSKGTGGAKGVEGAGEKIDGFKRRVEVKTPDRVRIPEVPKWPKI